MEHLSTYRKNPLMIIESIAEHAQYMMNSLPSKTLISTTMSARNVIKGRKNLDYNTMYIKLGE